MIISKKIEIIVSSRYYEKLRKIYNEVNIGDKLMIDVELLCKNSNSKVLVKCDVCGKEKYTSYLSYNKNIEKHNIFTCKGKCTNKKRELSNLSKFGFKYYSQTEEYKENCKKTCLMKYGVENVFQIDDVKNRIKEVNMKNLGVEYPTQSETIKNKIKEMNIIKYGVENVGQYNEVKNKIKKTNLEKYGVEYSFQSDNVKNKIKKTNLEKYGVEYSSQNKENRKKYKETCLKKYGVDNVSKSEKIKKKKEEISIERYGVNHVSQDPNIYMKQQKSGYRLNLHENTKLIYRGSYERDFLDFCFCNDIQISQGKRIKYFYENDIHYYFSDYYLESLNLIIEIKSSWTYNKYLNKNLAKEKATINSGYYYLVIKDKNYDEFKKFLEKKSEHFNINI